MLTKSLADAEPPPDTLTWMGVVHDGASTATFTVTVNEKLDPPSNTALVVQVGRTVQSHVAPPFIDTSVMPVGTVSVIVTSPVVGPGLAALPKVT